MKSLIFGLSLLAVHINAAENQSLEEARKLVSETIKEISKGNSQAKEYTSIVFKAREELAKDLSPLDSEFAKLRKAYLDARLSGASSESNKNTYKAANAMIADMEIKATKYPQLAERLKSYKKAIEDKEDFIGKELEKASQEKAIKYKNALSLIRKAK